MVSEMVEVPPPPGPLGPPPTPLGYASLSMTPRKPRVWPAYLMTVALLVGTFAVGIAFGVGLVVWTGLLHSPGNPTRKLMEVLAMPSVMLMLIGTTMLVEVVAISICLFFSQTRLRERLHLYWPNVSATGFVMAMLGAVSLSILCGVVVSLFQLHSSTLGSISRLAQRSSAVEFVIAYLLIAIVAPILEETIFRGYIQTRLIQRHGAMGGIVIASAFFGLFHFNLVQGTFAFSLGLFLGTLAHRTRSLYPSIVCHMAVNSVSMVTLALGWNEGNYWWVFAGVCSIVFLTSLWFLSRMKPAESVASVEGPGEAAAVA